MSITANEQYAIELLNRARLDPTGEAARYGLGLNEGLAAGTISAAPKQVLAPYEILGVSASRHSQWMLENDIFSHTGENNSQPDQRMSAAGYEFSGGWSWGENLALASLNQGRTFNNVIDTHHQGLMESPLHRVNIMRDSFREIGYSQKVGSYDGYTTSVATENFAHRDDRVYVTGVAYNDRDKDKFYSQGEGESGIRFAIENGDKTNSAKEGGYAVLGSQRSGIAVEVTDDGTKSKVVVDLSKGNAKLDLVNGDTFMSSGNLKLVSGVSDAKLLGISNNKLFGNSDDNNLSGNSGNNRLKGGSGDDRLDGGSGRDKLMGGGDNDVLRGGSGNDKLRGDGGSDKLFGHGGRDQLQGGSGNDRLVAGGGNDKLSGGGGKDKIYGGSGDDVLTGDRGTDRLNGGKGSDTFVFNDHGGRDKIVDFNARAGDQLHLDSDLWSGSMSVAKVIDSFADVTNGGVVFDFGGGDVLTLRGLSSLSGLAEHIDII